MRLWINKEAQAEFEEAVEFYEHREPGLGKRFRRAIVRALRAILKNPERWPARDGFRKYLVPVFRYKIYYNISGGSLNVVAIAHPSREPGYWKERI